MIEEVMRLPASSFFFNKFCQLSIYLRKAGHSKYYIIEEIGNGFQRKDIENFQSEIKFRYRNFQSEIEMDLPFIIVDFNERQVYYQELHKTLDRCLTSYMKILEFFEFIRSKPFEKRTKDLCRNYISEEQILKSGDVDVEFEDLKTRMFIKVDADYDNADLNDVLDILRFHLKILSLASDLLAEKLSINKLEGSQLKWEIKVPVLGYIFLEMAKNQYFEMPSYQSEPNFREMGRIACRFFGIEETDYNLKQFAQKSNALGPIKKNKFSFPNALDLQ